jgi:hypothetical protein
VDVAVDGLDYFAVDARALFYRVARERGIPVVTAGPLGCSTVFLVFTPDGTTWEEYYAMDLAQSELDRVLLFTIGTTPRGLHWGYVDSRYVNLAERKGPSLSAAVQLCAGVAAIEVMKLLTHRGRVWAAPHFHQFDAYKGRFVRGRLPRGNRSLKQRLKLEFLRRRLENSPGTNGDARHFEASAPSAWRNV